jgi:hypothetical protein
LNATSTSLAGTTTVHSASGARIFPAAIIRNLASADVQPRHDVTKLNTTHVEQGWSSAGHFSRFSQARDERVSNGTRDLAVRGVGQVVPVVEEAEVDAVRRRRLIRFVTWARAKTAEVGTIMQADVKLYFDSFIYHLIQRRDEAAQVRSWRRSHGHEIGISINANIGEALRNPDHADRDARLHTILRVGSPIHPPYDYRHYREIANEVWRLRPEWFREAPDRRRIDEYLRQRKREWLKLKDPSRLPDLTKELLRINALVGREMGRQKRHRRRPDFGVDWRPRHTSAEVQRCMDERTQADEHWRYVGAEETRPALDEERRANRHLSWLVDFRWPQPVDEWQRLWMCDVDATRVPLCRVVGLTEFFQRRRQVTPGNSVDRLHAPHLWGFDWLLTTDRPFFQVLQDVRAEMPDVALARVALIDSDAPSALAAIEAALATM